MYAKVFSQIYDGTLVTKGPWQALVTFQQMLVLADLDGSVDMTAIAISRRTTIPLEIIELGIAELLKPDPESRTPDEGGRRIVPLREGRSWGWRVVNYKHYRALKREEDRREYHRDYWHKRKLKDSTPTQQAQPSQPIAEADTESEAIHPPTPRKRRERASRLPTEWNPGEAGFKFAAEYGITGQRAASELAKFRDYWSAKGGQSAMKTDWAATWRNWIRTSAERSPAAAPSPPPNSGRVVEQLRREVQEFAERTPEQVEAARRIKEAALAAVKGLR